MKADKITRTLCELCYLLALFTHSAAWSTLRIVVCSVCAVLITIRGTRRTHADVYRPTFIGMSLFLVVFQLYHAMRGSSRAISLGLSLAYLLLGITTLRSLRVGAWNDLSWHAKDSGIVVLVVTLTILALWGLVLLYGVLGKTLIYIAFPFLYLFVLVTRGISYLFGILLDSIEWKEVEPPEPVLTTFDSIGQNMDFDIDKLAKDITPVNFPFRYVAIAFLLLVLGFVVWRLVRTWGPKEKAPGHSANDSVALSGDELPPRRRRRATDGIGNAQKVRRIYREYLSFLSGKGTMVQVNDTSLDVLEYRLSDPACTLREIYIKARYSRSKVTDDDVRICREALDAIRKA